MLAALSNVSFILRHPLNRDRPVRAAVRLLRWHVGSRLVPGPVAVPFVDDTRLLVTPGMTGATGNVYCGLHEFTDMAFVLHALRPGDLFVDVGANVGSYTVLAGGACGARVVAAEPIPAAFARLCENARLNGLDAAEILNIGVGAAEGEVLFSTRSDTVNRVIAPGDARADRLLVPVRTLDSILGGREPTIIKVDVEGYEAAVVAGAAVALAAPDLLAVLLELTGQGARYGFDERALRGDMVRRGFTPCRYDPESRALAPLAAGEGGPGNVLFVRDVARAQARALGAPRRRVHGRSI